VQGMYCPSNAAGSQTAKAGVYQQAANKLQNIQRGCSGHLTPAPTLQTTKLQQRPEKLRSHVDTTNQQQTQTTTTLRACHRARGTDAGYKDASVQTVEQQTAASAAPDTSSAGAVLLRSNKHTPRASKPARIRTARVSGRFVCPSRHVRCHRVIHSSLSGCIAHATHTNKRGFTPPVQGTVQHTSPRQYRAVLHRDTRC
jgi:hypothetical protein